MNLLLDYYKPSSGNVMINDVPVSDVKNLNDIITVMRQDTILII